MEGVVMPSDFWSGRRIFLTGHTGFKGSWLTLWLKTVRANVLGYSLPPPTSPSLFEIARVGEGVANVTGDIRDLGHLKNALGEFKPEIVIHMAAQPLVRRSYADPIETYSTNIMGTVNLFEAVRLTSSVKVVLIVTSDKCYRNQERERGYSEEDPLGGTDPYSSSKGCAEIITEAYRHSFFGLNSVSQRVVCIASARAGNVIGGGDWAEDRLIPDVIRAVSAGLPPAIRRPNAVRPWQHVLEATNGYLMLVENMYEHGECYAGAWNFGPDKQDEKQVDWVVNQLLMNFNANPSCSVQRGIHPKEANALKLNAEKAKERLGWKPMLKLTDAIQLVSDWTKRYWAGEDPELITLDQIEKFRRSTIK